VQLSKYPKGNIKQRFRQASGFHEKKKKASFQKERKEALERNPGFQNENFKYSLERG